MITVHNRINEEEKDFIFVKGDVMTVNITLSLMLTLSAFYHRGKHVPFKLILAMARVSNRIFTSTHALTWPCGYVLTKLSDERARGAISSYLGITCDHDNANLQTYQIS